MSQQAELDHKLGQQADLVANLKAKQADVRNALAAAEAAEQQLKERLAREQRERELQDRLQKARAVAAASATKKGSSAPLPRGKSVVVVGGFQCPVPGSSFSSTFGAPRSGGRRHQGVDMMAGRGTSIYAVVSGSVSHSSSGLGGNQIWLHGSDGNTYFYAHLSAYVGGGGAVERGRRDRQGRRHREREGHAAPPLRDPSGRGRRSGPVPDRPGPLLASGSLPGGGTHTSASRS